MLLIVYLVLLAAVVFLTAGKENVLRGSAIFALNTVYAVFLLLCLQIGAGNFASPGLAMKAVFQILASGVKLQVFTDGFSALSAGFWIFGDPDWVSFQLFAIAILMSLYTASAVIRAFLSRQLHQIFFRFRSFRAKQEYVLVGYSGDCEKLLDSIRKKEEKASISLVLKDKLDNASPLYRKALLLDETFLKKLRPEKSCQVFLLSPNDKDNITWLRRLNEEGKRLQELYATALLDSEIIRFRDIKTENVDDYIVSREQILVNGFLNEHPPVELAERSGLLSRPEKRAAFLKAPMAVCVIGFGGMGREYFLSLYENSAFLLEGGGEESLHALVIDEHLYTKKEEFLTEAPHFARTGTVEFCNTSIHTWEYFQTIRKYLPHIQQFFICTGDTGLNIKTAMKLTRFLQNEHLYQYRPDIVVCLDEPDVNGELLLAEQASILTLPLYEDIYTWEALVERSLDQEARRRNEIYRRSNMSGEEWKRLSTFVKNSNRAVIRDLDTKRALIHPGETLTGEERELLVDDLAAYEHRRWNAFHYAHGWDTLPVEELTEEEKKSFVTKHPEEKRHICLVPWEKLDGLPQKKPGLLKKYDVDSIQGFLKELDQ